MLKLYPSNISVTQYAKIEPILSNFKKKTKPRIVDSYCVFVAYHMYKKLDVHSACYPINI